MIANHNRSWQKTRCFPSILITTFIVGRSHDLVKAASPIEALLARNANHSTRDRLLYRALETPANQFAPITSLSKRRTDTQQRKVPTVFS